MAVPNEVPVEVAYARADKQVILTVNVLPGTTIKTVIQRSGILEMFPEIDLMKQKVGIFSQLKKLTDVVTRGDRVEIYRALTIDPKEARRSRVFKENLKRNKSEC